MGTILFFSNFCVDSFERAASGFPKKAFYMTIRSHRALSAQKDHFLESLYFGHFFVAAFWNGRWSPISENFIHDSRAPCQLSGSPVVKKIHSYAATNEPFENTITFWEVKFSLKTVRIPMQNQKCQKYKDLDSFYEGCKLNCKSAQADFFKVFGLQKFNFATTSRAAQKGGFKWLQKCKTRTRNWNIIGTVLYSLELFGEQETSDKSEIASLIRRI